MSTELGADPTALRSPFRVDANAGRVALITGGGTGIGRASALELAATGADVVICGRREEPLQSTAQQLERAGANCLAIPADIREPEQAEQVIDGALERFGRIDVLVNNAGGQFSAAAEEISDRGWRAVHRLAVDAAWILEVGSAIVAFLTVASATLYLREWARHMANGASTRDIS